MSANQPVEFDITGPLPTGTTALEASAGTGKTWTIAGLVARYVAEGVATLDQLLVVTFSRAATNELRTRVRERLRDVAAELDEALRTGVQPKPTADPVVVLLADPSTNLVADRLRRLRSALAAFDAATVATTHEFCQQVLRSLGTAADLDPGTQLQESLTELVTEVADDLLLRHHLAGGPHFADPSEARRIAREAVVYPDALLLPDPAASQEVVTTAALRARYAAGVRAETDRRKRAQRLLGYDDLLLRVRDALTHEITGPVARERLRERYRVVLVDEFQDTDPVQWDVLRAAFHGHRPLVLIGDPKQSIYAFRGADVRAYLDASTRADLHATLGTSFRGDPRLVDGLSTLLRGAALGDAEIVVRPVTAGKDRATLTTADGAADAAPVRLRLLSRDGQKLTQDGAIPASEADGQVAADVAAQVAQTLQEGLHVDEPTGRRELRLGDVAVLVRTGGQVTKVCDALRERGIPCVTTRSTDVFAGEAALEWLVLLQALELPHALGRIRRLALSAWVGWDAGTLVASEPGGADRLSQTVHGWSRAVEDLGTGALLPTAAAAYDLWGRVLSRPDGDRLATDLRHVGEALHQAAREADLGVSGLASWLRLQIDEAKEGREDQERARRLDTEASAVQVLTVHASKGLEFPVVLAPFAWKANWRTTEFPRDHVTTDDGRSRRTLVVGGKDLGAAYNSALTAHRRDEAAEELRLLYVAVTRAVGRLVVWWAPGHKGGTAPLSRLLFAPDPVQLPPSVSLPTDRDAVTGLGLRAGDGSGMTVDRFSPTTAAPDRLTISSAGTAGPLAARPFQRTLDQTWRRLSYTGLTRGVHDQPAARVTSEPQTVERDDEHDADELVDAVDPTLVAAEQPAEAAAVPSPMRDLPSGAAFGVLVHEVLELADLAGHAGGSAAALEEAATVAGATTFAGLTPEVLAAALGPAVATPLGPLADDRPLGSFSRTDVLAELDFELPVGGGDAPSPQRLLLGRLPGLLRTHLPVDDRVRDYADLLAVPELADQTLLGYLTGSVDALLRVNGSSAPRYVVVDYKTNRLAPPDEPLTSSHYTADAIHTEVLASHYPLQALLYTVAVHRFLRWRQPGYDPDQHLGGVLYLFLRGMLGPDHPGSGLWTWQPPASLVVATSDLLAGDLS